MPTPDDGVADVVVEGPPADDATAPPGQEQKKMALDIPEGFGGLEMAALAQSGRVAQNNFITVQKVVDFDYLENKRIVTLDEAIGVREVAAEKSPGGPTKP